MHEYGVPVWSPLVPLSSRGDITGVHAFDGASIAGGGAATLFATTREGAILSAGAAIQWVEVFAAPSPLRAISGAGDYSLLAVGDNGLVLRWTGRASNSSGAWQREVVPGGGALRAVAVLDENEAWAVGAEGLVLHLSGGGWAPVPLAPPVELHGVAADDRGVWLVGEGGTIFRRQGEGFVAQESGTKVTLRGIAARDGLLFAVGDRGSILRSDGSRWSVDSPIVEVPLHAVRIVDQARAFAAGADGTILDYSGGAWRVASQGQTREVLRAIGSARVSPPQNAGPGGADSSLLAWAAGDEGTVQSFEAPRRLVCP